MGVVEGEGKGNVTEAAGDVIVDLEVFAGELATPDDIVTDAAWNGEVKAITLSLDEDLGGAVPVGLGSAVVLGQKEGTGCKLVRPLGDKNCIERDLLANLGAAHYHHKVGD